MLPVHFGLFAINDSVELVKVSGRICIDLLRRQRLTGFSSFARIAQASCPIANDNDGLMPQALKLAQLAKDDGMSNRQIVLGRDPT